MRSVSAAVRAGRNELEIRYVNNWHNRLVGDCMLPSEKRITKTPLPYWDHARDEYGDKYPYSKGYSSHDPLLPSGLLGPLEVILFHNQK